MLEIGGTLPPLKPRVHVGRSSSRHIVRAESLPKKAKRPLNTQSLRERRENILARKEARRRQRVAQAGARQESLASKSASPTKIPTDAHHACTVCIESLDCGGQSSIQCDTIREEGHSCVDNEADTLAYLDKNTKNCPGCTCPTQKDYDCDHMICKSPSYVLHLPC